jgi:hypothetical protein
MSSMRAGARRDTNARRSTRPPMVAAASRARLCLNTSAFTSVLLLPGSQTYQNGMTLRSGGEERAPR